MEEMSEILEFYADKTILLTGASGFIGKVLIWKLLHSCSSVKNIFILLRPRKGKTALDRKDELLKSPIFESFKTTNPGLLKKIKIISGDVGEDNLGLSDSDRQMLIEEVAIVFYSAGLLKINADLKYSVNVNTKGVARCLDMALEMKKLVSFVYVSTAYCNCEQSIIEERVYRWNENPQIMLKCLDWLPQQVLRKVKSEIISPLKFPYLFSKRLAELLLLEYEKRLPLVIARPSVVIGSLREPIPGWVDSSTGMTGVMAGAASGVIHFLPLNEEKILDIVQVDIVCNCLIAIPWGECKRNQRFSRLSVYHLTQTENHQTYGMIIEKLKGVYLKYPFQTMFWYPSINLISRYAIIPKMLVILCQLLPAYILDLFLLLLGRRRFMVREQEKFFRTLSHLTYVGKNQWVFKTSNIFQLEQMMNEKDRSIFPVTQQGMCLEKNIYDTYLIIRKYMLNENVENPGRNRGKLKLFFGINVFTKLVVFYLIFKLLKNPVGCLLQKIGSTSA